MDTKQTDKIAAFDTLYTNNHIQMLKILLPVIGRKQRHKLAVYIKYMELQYTMSLANSSPLSFNICAESENTSVDFSVLLDELFPFCTEKEQAMMKKEMNLEENKRKHRFGALALFFPIIYTLIDVFSIAEISGVGKSVDIISEEAEYSIPAIDFFIFECAGFALVAIFVWLYMLIVKKYIYNPFHEDELLRCGAATSETVGTMAFLFAASMNPVLTAPITSLYCLVTIVLARIFLKERLTKKQFISLGFLIAGIALFGISGILSI